MGEVIYVYTKLNNTIGKTLKISTGTILLETADAGANQKIYFIGGFYVGVIYPITNPTLTTGVASIDPLNPGAPGGFNGTFIVMFQLETYDQSIWSNGVPDGAIFLGTGAVNNQAEDGTYSSLLFFLDGIYMRSCNWDGSF